MDTKLVSQLLAYFKTTFGLTVNNAEQLFDTQRNLLEYLIGIGRELENRMFEELGRGYEGATIERDGKRYKFVDYRSNSIHGLFGEIRYRRAYYVGESKELAAPSRWMNDWGLRNAILRGSTIFFLPSPAGKPIRSL